ncbi:MAG: nicotinate-nucleotide adenylyltransferase [PVC group bacterium]|nr:nicotinate-nucleotide adenylyltransferase [PVC group bacterium]
MDKLENKKRIGILGGTFDPIHVGHLVLAEKAKAELDLDKVIFIPAHIPPHKTRDDIIDVELRYAMVEAAVSDNESFITSRIEIEKKDISYTIETVQALQQKFPESEFWLIVGSDAQLYDWKNVDELFKICRFAVAKRPQFKIDEFPADTAFIDGAFLNVSSTQIRGLIKRGESVANMLPEKVYQFIKEHSLYV